MKISKYVTFEEATKSQTATRLNIDNSPNDDQLEAMKYVAHTIFDPVRDYINGPLHASSFFRCKALNDAVGGSSSTSQHMRGEAIDMDCDTFGFGSNNQILDWITRNLEFDQLIGEYPDINGKFSWVHCSATRTHNRKQILVKLKDKYINFSDWKPGMI